MGTSTAPTVAVRGISTAVGRLDEDASSIAANGPDVRSVVDMNAQSDTLAALVQVIRAGDQMTGSVIDLLA
jgi:hypothetical protein